MLLKPAGTPQASSGAPPSGWRGALCPEPSLAARLLSRPVWDSNWTVMRRRAEDPRLRLETSGVVDASLHRLWCCSLPGFPAGLLASERAEGCWVPEAGT